MSYISLINDFWKAREKEIIPSHTADFYLYLLHRCNKGNWMNPFSLSTKEIERDLEMTRPTIYKARVLLKSLGLVEFREGKTRGNHSIYMIKNAPKKSECVNECVKEIYTIEGECVNECVKEIYTMAEKKESFPPDPLYKEKKEIYKEKKNLASLDTRDTHTRERSSVDVLEEYFSESWIRERLMKQNGIHDTEEYESLMRMAIGDIAIKHGDKNFEVNNDTRQHAMNLLRIKKQMQNDNIKSDTKDKRRATPIAIQGEGCYDDTF